MIDDCRCGYHDEQHATSVQEQPVRSRYRCPVCDLLLSMEDTLSGGVALFCTEANCPSYSCTNGVEGRNEQDAEHKLKMRVQMEIEQNDRP